MDASDIYPCRLQRISFCKFRTGLTSIFLDETMCPRPEYGQHAIAKMGGMVTNMNGRVACMDEGLPLHRAGHGLIAAIVQSARPAYAMVTKCGMAAPHVGGWDRLLLAIAAPAIRRWQLQRLARRQQPRTAGDRVCLIRSWRRPGPLCRLLALCAAYDVGVDVSLGCMTNFDVEVAQQLPSLGSSLGILRFTSHVCSTASTHFCQGTETRHGQ